MPRDMRSINFYRSSCLTSFRKSFPSASIAASDSLSASGKINRSSKHNGSTNRSSFKTDDDVATVNLMDRAYNRKDMGLVQGKHKSEFRRPHRPNQNSGRVLMITDYPWCVLTPCRLKAYKFGHKDMTCKTIQEKGKKDWTIDFQALGHLH